MIDLAAKVHYKARFEIHRKNPETNLFDVFFLDIERWVNRKLRNKAHFWNWDRIAKYASYESNDGNAFINSTSHFISNEHRYWAMKFDEVQYFESDDSNLIETSPRTWSTEIGYEQESANSATVSLVCYYIDKAGYVGVQAEPPRPTTPQIFYRFLTNDSFECISGLTKLSVKEIALGNGYGEKLGAEIQCKTRGLPYILIVPEDQYITGSKENARDWAKNLAMAIAPHIVANAIVLYAEDSAFSEEFSYFIPKNLRCFPGSLCIYWPVYSDNKGQEEVRRRFFTPGQIKGLGKEGLIKIIRRVLSNDINYYESKEMFRRQDCDTLYRRHKTLELRMKLDETQKSASQASEALSIAEELLGLADQESSNFHEKTESMEDQIRKLETENNGLRHYNAELNIENSRLREQANSLDSIRAFPDMPQTYIEIVEFFQSVFPDRIAFTDRALKSLDSCVTKPGIVWNCLHAIANSLVDLYRLPSSPTIPSDFKQRTGWDMARGEGPETRKSTALMQLRRDDYLGKEILIEPHVKKGNKDNPDSIRVYFAYDPEIDKIIIGHIGIHIDNYSTSRL